MPLRCRTWAILALGAALFGGAREIQAQPLNEPPPRPLALSEAPPPRLKLTVPDDGLAASGNPIQMANYRPDVNPAPALLKLPAQVTVEVTGPSSVTLGDPLHYELIVRNTGGSPACRVQVEAPFPSDAKLLQTDPVGEVRAGSLNWDLGTLEAGAERRLKVDLQPLGIAGLTQPPRVAYTAAVGLRTQVVRPPFTVVLVGPETAVNGAKVLFQIQISNNGTTPIRRIVLRDQLPPGLSYLGGRLIEAEVGDLAPGCSHTVRLDATAAQVGRYVNEIVAVADGGLRTTSRCGFEILVRPDDKPNGASPFAAGR